MYIKQIIIQGFKSYRDQTVIEPFDPRHNVVVGRNGSGKSNFFYAIQFVLSDEFSYLRPEQRQSLLHEGTGPRVISAYVEIIFDNTDGRLPIDRDEVFLRRVIGSKKDQYFLNKKVVPRSDVMNLLESAGFSRSNPYYIVKQGKINQMATAPDSHRLKLLREVAGTRVYDERREESKLLLKESESRRDKVEECLRTIGERLSALEEEQEELKEYQKWDRMRRALEYTIHDQDLKEARRKLEDMDKKRNTSGEEQAKLTALMHRADEKVKVAVKKLKEAKAEVASAREERDAYNAENQLLLKEKARLELTIRDLSDEVNGDDRCKERAEAELARLRETIAQKEASLAEILPQYEEMKRREDECSTDLAVKEQKRQELYARQGRSSQFSSKDQRDQWIRSELRSLKKQLADKEFQINQLTEDMRKDSEKKADLQTRIQERAGDVDRYRSNIDDQTKGLYELRKQKDAMQSQRNELWRRENVLQQTLASVKEDMHRTEQAMRSMVGKPVLNGRDSVDKVLATFRERGGEWQSVVDGYHGPVIKLFQCEQAIYTAVEVTAGNRLFHHVVDTDVIGTQILKEMNRQKLPGEVTFMPLNRLTVREIQYPQTDNAFPMVSRLKFDERFDRALRQIFGRTLICRNLELATQLARQHRLDCVTIEGDQAMSKGSLTGGFFNPSRSRLETQKLRVELQQQLDEAQTEMGQLLAKLEEIGQDINRTVTEMQKTETKSGKAKDVFEKVKTDIRLMKEELISIERSQQPKERSLATLRANRHSMQGTLESLEAELHQELMTVLSSDDQRQVDQLNDEIRRLELTNKETFAARMRLEGEKNKLENLLANNLNRRLDELQQAMQELSVEDRKRQLELSSGELERCSAKLVETSKRLKEFDNALTALQQKQSHSDSEVERWTAKRKEVQERMEDDAKDLEKMASRQNVLQQKIQEYTRKIRELGSLPSDAFGSMYQTLSSKQLFKKLEQCNAELKKYCNVNKKAGDQFIHFTEQKERLRERKEEQEKGYEKIMELMSVLEQRKCEAIFRTFKQVSAYFSEVFRKLVPQGHGQLIMKTDRDDQDESSVQQPATVNTFTGVGIRVSFTSKTSDTREMNQLSGGQKSLVALAIIFAIQKCDPAPFYLFDEIDQALDPTHRQSVAAMIHDLCGKAQFITTTFRPELLQHANKFYGVKFRNKVSHVVCVSRDEAHDFVEDDATHG